MVRSTTFAFIVIAPAIISFIPLETSISIGVATAGPVVMRAGRTYSLPEESMDAAEWNGVTGSSGGQSSVFGENVESKAELAREEGFGPKFRRVWVPITVGEIALLGITATLPKDWTGWSSHFVADGAAHLKRAWTSPPVIDNDRWFHNYLGHPYAGSIYYNSIRSQGGTVGQSFLMSVILSTQWEYCIEAVAERPSIQDLIVTPVVGSVLGELTHRAALRMRRNGTTVPEKIAIAVLNPMSICFGMK